MLKSKSKSPQKDRLKEAQNRPETAKPAPTKDALKSEPKAAEKPSETLPQKAAVKSPEAAPVQAAKNAPESPPETGATPPPARQLKTDISFSGGLYNFLAARQISLAFTSYQTGILYILGHGRDKKLSLHQAHYPQAMGVVGNGARLYLASLNQIIRLENIVGPNQLANDKHDKVYVPRNFQTTGAVDLHEIGVCKDGRVVFINTKYSCLCELSLKHSFKPIWKPSFISQLAPEDRCHLNGLAMEDGVPRYASAVCRSDVVDGWRDRREDGGIIIDIETDEIVAEGLSMPHSPRVYDGKLWVINSGSGELGWIDRKTKTFKPVAFCPGFVRGLAFVEGHAIVTLSKPRYQRFDGLALADKLKEKDADPWCGVLIISLSDGSITHWVRFDGAIQEMFDVCILPGVRDALTVGPHTAEYNSLITFEPLPETGKETGNAPEIDTGPAKEAEKAKPALAPEKADAR
ncbi:MAG: TIGR03032 family protein [Pseudomonadota bacterium]